MGRYILGIDPGLDGGIAFLRLDAPQTPSVYPMPTTRLGKGREVDPVRLADLIEWFGGVELVVLEKVASRPGQGVCAVFTFGVGVGTVRGVVGAKRLRLETPTPQEWKRGVLLGSHKGKTKADQKAAAVAYCLRAYPLVDLIPKGCRVPHDGMAEALCLAEYGRRLVTGKGVA